MGTNEYSQPACKSSWDSQDFGDVNMVLKWPIFTSPPDHNELMNVWGRENSLFQKSTDLNRNIIWMDILKNHKNTQVKFNV